MKITVEHNGIEYNLDYGSKAYILESALWYEMDRSYSKEEILEYVETTYKCYIKDDSHTPLGALADYVAEHWEEVRHHFCQDILRDFYASL